MKTLLVGIMYAGECQYEQCKAALAAQDMQDFDVFCIENLPNKEAHDALYRRFADEQNNYRYFSKLDADIIFTDAGVLSRMIAQFEPDVDGVTVNVMDWLSGQPMTGYGLQTGRVKRRLDSGENLFVDGGLVAGRWVHVKNKPWCLHNPEPTPWQAFRFGLHRTSKALQPDRPVNERMIDQGLKQHVIMQAVARMYNATQHPARLWAMIGCEMMYMATDRRLMEYNGAYAKAIFDDLYAKPTNGYATHIREFWSNESEAIMRWLAKFSERTVMAA